MDRNNYKGVMILALDPDPEYNFQPYGDSESRFGSCKKWNRNTSTQTNKENKPS